jgi:hypothetical protein
VINRGGLIHRILTGNQQFRLMQDPAVFDRAETAIRARLESVGI